MKVISRIEENKIANVYIGENSDGKLFEFVESVQPPLNISDKWVLIISTLYGCPVNCLFCDAGGNYKGILSYEEIMFQIDFLIKQRFSDKIVNSKKFKIQFSRMGEPSFNKNVLRVLNNIPQKYSFENFIPSLSSVAPTGTDNFFEELLEIKKRYYNNSFQLQFSLHSTDKEQRDKLVPIKKWDFEKIAEFGNRFCKKDSKKITLNFALSEENIMDINVLKKYFNPDVFLIKITPVNPTFKAIENKINSLIKPEINNYAVIDNLKKAGYEVILSIGDLEENKIGSNCGQYITALKNNKESLEEGYTYKVEEIYI